MGGFSRAKPASSSTSSSSTLVLRPSFWLFVSWPQPLPETGCGRPRRRLGSPFTFHLQQSALGNKRMADRVRVKGPQGVKGVPKEQEDPRDPAEHAGQAAQAAQAGVSQVKGAT
uniref:HDC16124 n=1 Tax=Drosophila melanogaster TaxID=7227 RepID=Q6IJ22_DROME|nr:TPA_inf: HDC16124 [Drosophila melanogaster]